MKSRQELAPLAGGEITPRMRAAINAITGALVDAGVGVVYLRSLLGELESSIRESTGPQAAQATLPQTGAEAEAAGRAAYEADAAGPREYRCVLCGIVSLEWDDVCECGATMLEITGEEKRLRQAAARATTGPQAAQAPKAGK
jgi:hypothetical protein